MLSDHLSPQSAATIVAVVEQPQINPPDVRKAENSTSALLALTDRRELFEDGRAHQALFAVRSWTPPPVEAAKSNKDTAPPLPFGYAGKVREHGKWTVFLTRDNEILAVKEGDKIDSTYWVKSIQLPTMEIIYSPLEQSQEMNIE